MYCSVNDILERMPELDLKKLSQDDWVSSDIDMGKVNAAIADATALMNGKLARRFIIPVEPRPDALIRIAVDIAIYYIYRNRYDNKIPEEVKEQYTESLSMLEDFAQGRVALVGAHLLPAIAYIIRSRHNGERVFGNNITKSL